MDRLAIAQCIQIIKTYNNNSDSATTMYRALRGTNYTRIGKIVKKFEETGVVTNIERAVHHHFARSAENIAIVSESVANDPNVSILRRPQELELSYGTLWRILHLDLHLHPNKVQFKQQLKPADHLQRHRYVEYVSMLITKIVVFGVLRLLK